MHSVQLSLDRESAFFPFAIAAVAQKYSSFRKLTCNLITKYTKKEKIKDKIWKLECRLFYWVIFVWLKSWYYSKWTHECRQFYCFQDGKFYLFPIKKAIRHWIYSKFVYHKIFIYAWEMLILISMNS